MGSSSRLWSQASARSSVAVSNSTPGSWASRPSTARHPSSAAVSQNRGLG